MLVFISYSRRDEVFALKLANDLKANDVPIWIDQIDIPTGVRWDSEIEKALEKSTHFILVMSENSRESENVRDELDFAMDAKKHIIPILIDDCNPPLRVRRIQRIDFTKDYAHGLDDLLTILPISESTQRKKPALTISGQWINTVYLEKSIIFLKQVKNRFVGFYDLGSNSVVGIYYGEMIGNELKHKWRWVNFPPSPVYGSGRLTVDHDNMTLSGAWWYDDKKGEVNSSYSFVSNKMPFWLSDKDFEPYLDYLHGKVDTIEWQDD